MKEDSLKNIDNVYNENNDLIRNNSVKIHELNLLNFEDRIGRISITSGLLYMIAFLSLCILQVPGTLFPLLVIVSSFGPGAVINFLVEKKAKCKERFKKVSNSKNEVERLQEILKLEMDSEKLSNRNSIFANIEFKIKNDINLIKKAKSKFYIKAKRTNYSKEELNNKINELENSLKEKFTLLDNLTDKSFLLNRKGIVDDKLNSVFHSIMASSYTTILAGLTFFYYMINPLPTPSFIPAFTVLGISASTFIGSLVYYNLKRKNVNKAISSFGINLDEEQDKLSSDINNLIIDISNMLYTLVSYKHEYENYDSIHRDRNKSKNMVPSLEEEYTLDDEYKLTLK